MSTIYGIQYAKLSPVDSPTLLPEPPVGAIWFAPWDNILDPDDSIRLERVEGKELSWLHLFREDRYRSKICSYAVPNNQIDEAEIRILRK